MRRVISGLIAAVLLIALPASSLAHHSFSAEYDINKPVTITGRLTRMRWANPHAWIYIDVSQPDGGVVGWSFELTGVNILYRRGWKQTDLVPGEQITIQGWLARNGTPTGNASSIKLSDGRELTTGSATSDRQP